MIQSREVRLRVDNGCLKVTCKLKKSVSKFIKIEKKIP